jgi:purine-binding chemotaxis protein CheW
MTHPESTAELQAESLMMCTLRVGASLFGIEASLIREVVGEIPSKPVPLAPKYIAGVIPYRGDVLTTLSLRQLLGAEDATAASCILVLNDDQSQESFGLVVDSVHGLVTVARDILEPNPSSLDAPGMFLFDGLYRTNAGLMIRLNTHHLSPARIAQTKLFDHPSPQRSGWIQ